jgi:hypothetical protein
MEAGPTKLEEFIAEARERFARIETRLDQTATKADLVEAMGGLRAETRMEVGGLRVEISDLRTEMHKEFAAMVKWLVGTAIVLGASAITVGTFVLNYAAPPRTMPSPMVQTAPAVQPSPIIIQMPPYPAPAPRQ